jgi:hypothetical protein
MASIGRMTVSASLVSIVLMRMKMTDEKTSSALFIKKKIDFSMVIINNCSTFVRE